MSDSPMDKYLQGTGTHVLVRTRSDCKIIEKGAGLGVLNDSPGQ